MYIKPQNVTLFGSRGSGDVLGLNEVLQIGMGLKSQYMLSLPEEDRTQRRKKP